MINMKKRGKMSDKMRVKIKRFWAQLKENKMRDKIGK